LGSDELKVILAPGHSPGSICFYNEAQKFVIGGDVLFRESIGRTDLPGGNHATLLKSIRTQLFVLPDEVTVYPGHGTPTTIGFEKKNNPYLQ
jgi:glyoxylase-like metal-dependent hydrolase (beta-lactamase superfamily II)